MIFSHKKLFGLLTICVSFFSFAVHAQTPNEELTQLLKNMHSIQSDFTQTIVDKKGKTIQKSTGHMDLVRPNQFRWNVKSPNQQLIITNGKRLWIYDPDLEQVTIRKLTTAAGETPAMLLSDEDLSLGKEFTVRKMISPSDIQWYSLVPRDNSSMVTLLQLGFQNQKLKRMTLQDHLGHTTLIEFNHVVINSSISPTLFNFKPPAHIDVIDETQH